jgi:hypothetical protein
MEIQISHQAKKCKLPKKSSKRNQNTKLPSFHNSSTISSFNASRNIIFQESSYKRSWVHTRVRGQGLNRAFLRDPVSTNPAQVPALPPPHRSFPSHCRPARCLCVCGSLALSLSLSVRHYRTCNKCPTTCIAHVCAVRRCLAPYMQMAVQGLEF